MDAGLKDIPGGRSVFIDANIFHLYLRGPERPQAECIDLLERISDKELTGYTSALVLDELIYKILLRKIEEKHRRNPLAILRENPMEAGTCSRDIRRALQIIYGIDDLTILPVDRSHVEMSPDYIQSHSLMPRDAIHLSVMDSVGCIDLASTDRDFDRVTDIRRWSPLD